MLKLEPHSCLVLLILLSSFSALGSVGRSSSSSACSMRSSVLDLKSKAQQVNDDLLSQLMDRADQLNPNQIYTLKLFTRLTGSSISFQNPRFKRAVKFVTAGNLREAAKLATDEPQFLNIRARNLAAPMTSKDFLPSEPLNDMQTLIIGVIRDQLDARLLLTGNLRFQGARNFSLPPVSMENNEHFQILDEVVENFETDLDRIDHQWDMHTEDAVGVFTTRAWAKINYEAGTNRRTIKNAMEIFMCAPIESWKTRGVPDMFVRRDVDRLPAGNPANYQNQCRSCHGIMDGMAGAFAKLDFANSLFSINKQIMPKLNQNATTYPAGHVTIDDSWANLLPYNKGYDFGWRTSLEGKGLKSFANMLANSVGYSSCLIKKVYNEICETSLQDAALEKTLIDGFEKNNRNLKALFADIAIHPTCIAHPETL